MGLPLPCRKHSPRQHYINDKFCVQIITDRLPYHVARLDFSIIRAVCQGDLPADKNARALARALDSVVEDLLLECWGPAPEARPPIAWCLAYLTKAVHAREANGIAFPSSELSTPLDYAPGDTEGRELNLLRSQLCPFLIAGVPCPVERRRAPGRWSWRLEAYMHHYFFGETRSWRNVLM